MAAPNSGIKHLKLEECRHLQISSRPNTQYRTTLPQIVTKYNILAHGGKLS